MPVRCISLTHPVSTIPKEHLYFLANGFPLTFTSLEVDLIMAVWYNHFSLPDYYHSTRNLCILVSSTAATTIALLTIARIALYSPPQKVIPSPRSTLFSRLKDSEKAKLPYPPDAFPGTRDVDSPVS